MTEYTPGPWSFTEDDGSGVRSGDFWITGLIHIQNEGDWRANGRLIAAAPELLEAVQFALDRIQSRPLACTARAVARLEAAIAKALGATP